MTPHNDPVSKGEFISGSISIWMFIMLALGAITRLDPSWYNVVLFILAFFLLLVQIFQALKLKREARRGSIRSLSSDEKT